MPRPDFKNLSEYEEFLKNRLSPWPPEKRTILAAGMAERWVHTYREFSAREDWGDPAALRQGLDAIWAWLESGRSAKVDWKRLTRQVHEVTPHMDDFDDNEALCACVMVQYAIECCTARDNAMSAQMGMLSGLEAVLPDVLEEEHIPARLWRQTSVRSEIGKQMGLIERVESLVDTLHARQSLEPFLADAKNLGEAPAKPEPQEPTGRTNQELCEQYQKIIQQDIKGSAHNLDPRKFPQFATTLYLAAWMARYSRRKQIISGEYGALRDQAAAQMLVAKNQAADLAERRQPTWGQDADETIQLAYQNPYNGLDVHTVDSPHSYGPSLRRLWLQAKDRGLTDQQAWESIQAWAYHLPEAWSRKSNLVMKQTAVLEEIQNQPMAWNRSRDANIPWSAEVNGERWQVRLNDFPEESMYSLLINGENAGDFHDWPAAWRRE